MESLLEALIHVIACKSNEQSTYYQVHQSSLYCIEHRGTVGIAKKYVSLKEGEVGPTPARRL